MGQLSKGEIMAQNEVRIYETVFIITASLDDPTITSLIDKTKEFITTNGATIRSSDIWGRKRFAYPINKKTNGYYVVIEFSDSGELVHKLEKFFNIEQDIVRFITIKLDKKALLTKAKPKVEEGVKQ